MAEYTSKFHEIVQGIKARLLFISRPRGESEQTISSSDALRLDNIPAQEQMDREMRKKLEKQRNAILDVLSAGRGGMKIQDRLNLSFLVSKVYDTFRNNKNMASADHWANFYHDIEDQTKDATPEEVSEWLDRFHLLP